VFTLGVIPARGGSKGIPRKNLALLAGRPLLVYTCDAAKASRRLSWVMLSTDDEEIAAVGRACGIDVPFMRPSELAGDATPMVDVLRHALRFVEREAGHPVDAVAVLQPTSPLRESFHIDAAIELLESSGADSVVTVVEVPHRFSPVSVMQLEKGSLTPWLPGPSPTRRQDKPVLLARNGPAVLVVKRHIVLGDAGLYAGDCRPLRMGEAESLDVDSPWDLLVAELALLHRRGRDLSFGLGTVEDQSRE
jgi:CMP-N-acetylneuraminic acid synthetase